MASTQGKGTLNRGIGDSLVSWERMLGAERGSGKEELQDRGHPSKEHREIVHLFSDKY